MLECSVFEIIFSASVAEGDLYNSAGDCRIGKW
jgi:hypothetical protein